jgi:exodeoxyribonuclease V beta subunit
MVAEVKRQVNAKSDADRLADLSMLAQRSNGRIEVVSLPEPSDGHLSAQPDRSGQLSCRNFSGSIDTSWKVSSYSALISRQTADIDLPDRDAFGELVRHMTDRLESEIESNKAPVPDGIFAFPKGSRAGNFFHDLLERLDYTAGSAAALNNIILRTLQAYGFDDTWQDVIADTISHVLHVPLIPQLPELTLSAIGFNQRINEMEFYFPLNTIQPLTLQAVFKRHGHHQSRMNFPVQLQKLMFSPVGGFMKGYIDLVFQHRHQFFLVDWKSNYMGPTIDSYHRDALDVVMHDNFYVLQYHLYVLALCQYLRQRNSAFQYQNDFGGVLYIFIRGIDHRRSSESGIYFDRPEAALLSDLGQALIPNFEKFT